MKRGEKGFTLLELLIVVATIMVVSVVVVGGVYGTLFTGNFWFTEDGVLRELRANHPEVVQIVHIQRNIWGYSIIETADGNGNRNSFQLDSNILFNYSFH